MSFDRRSLQIAATIAIAVALVGFLTGTRPRQREVWGAPPAIEEGSGAPLAPTHAELGSDSEESAIAARQRRAFEVMRADRRGLLEDIGQPTQAEREADVAARALLRAYDGAPPRVPHEVRQLGSLDCLACHEEGLRVSEARSAPMMSHRALTSCTQCHVPDEAPMPGAERALLDGPPIDSTFVGMASPVSAPRAYDGAPPQMPHPTNMRETCASCHGVMATGIRSSHPWRVSCTQCHAPSAEMDQAPRSDVGPPPGEEAHR